MTRNEALRLPQRRSIRLKDYDYSQEGGYFLTICTHHYLSSFGEIVDGVMQLSDIGVIVEEEWLRSAELRKEMIFDRFVVMPNHFQGIVRISYPNAPVVLKSEAVVGAHGCAPVPRRPRSISSFIAQFKAKATKRIHELKMRERQPVWQRNYHEHVIRDEDDLQRIKEYVVNNPLKWHLDRYYMK